MKRSSSIGAPDGPVTAFKDQKSWEAWLQKHHGSSAGIWVKIARANSGLPSVSYAEALESALCYGWIDATKKGLDARWWLQRFTPRGERSVWSKINRAKALDLIRTGKMKPPGLRAVEEAKKSGAWSAAYDSPASARVPADFGELLKKSPRASAFFQALDSRNRYSILRRIQIAKKAETRERRIREFVEMLERGERLHP